MMKIAFPAPRRISRRADGFRARITFNVMRLNAPSYELLDGVGRLANRSSVRFLRRCISKA
jgi:hypothetical protein